MAKPMTRRQKRVSELLRREICYLLKTKIKDPRLGFVTVTGVEVSFDLKDAYVYVSALEGAERKEEILEGLNSASGFLRRQIAEALRLKFIPRLKFLWDDSLERGQRIEKILRKLAEERNERGDSESP